VPQRFGNNPEPCKQFFLANFGDLFEVRFVEAAKGGGADFRPNASGGGAATSSTTSG